jgi:sugar lactone lactonase YvrE
LVATVVSEDALAVTSTLLSQDLSGPSAVCVDSTGNCYYTAANKIGKVTPSGRNSIFAGSAASLNASGGNGVVITLYDASGLALDQSGNLFVADGGIGKIYKISPAGTVSLFAGDGNPLVYADGAGSASSFNEIGNLAIDPHGNIYVADAGNHVIRKITPAGLVSTFAGTPQTAGYLDGKSSAAQFNSPKAVAVDPSGNVYVADSGNNLIRKITPGGLVSTLAGTASTPGTADGLASSAQFSNPGGIAVDTSGNLFVCDTDSSLIREISVDGFVSTPAGQLDLRPYGNMLSDGVGSSAMFHGPQCLVLGPNGILYIADTDNFAIRQATPTWFPFGIHEPQSQTAFAGSGVTIAVATPGRTPLTYYWSLNAKALTDGTMDDGSTVAGSTTDTLSLGAVTLAENGGRYTVAVSSGLYSYASPPAILTVHPVGFPTVQSIQAPAAPVTIGGPVTFSVSISGSQPLSYQWQLNGSNIPGATSSSFTIASARFRDTGTYTVVTTNSVGTVSSAVGTLVVTEPLAVTSVLVEAQGEFAYNPSGIAVDSAGNVYLPVQNAIEKISPAGVIVPLAGSMSTSGTADGTGTAARFLFPGAIVVDSSGNVFVADKDNHTIRKITPAGVVTTLAGSPTNYGSVDGVGAAAAIQSPAALAIDARGTLYIADDWDCTIRTVSPDGMVATLAGQHETRGYVDGSASSALFNAPTGVAIDASGNVYVADAGNNAIRIIDPAGTVSTLAGTPVYEGSGDGPALQAEFSQPTGLAIDRAGNLFVSDTGNSTIREISTNGRVYTPAGAPNAITAAPVDGIGSSARFVSPQGLALGPTGILYIVDATVPPTVRQAAAQWYPTGTGQPQSRTITSGSPATFTVTAATPTPLTYQWYRNGGALTDGPQSDGSLVMGSVSSTLAISELPLTDDGTNFTVVASSGFFNYTSPPATLAIQQPPTIATQPANQLVNTGSSATFTIIGAGDPTPTYQWCESADGVIWTPLTDGSGISGSSTSSLTLSNVNASVSNLDFECVLTNALGTATSSPAGLILISPPAITVQPQSQTIAAGAGTTLTVGASGNGLSYQWQLNGTPIAGATGATLALPTVGTIQAGSYTAVVNNALGWVTTDPAIVTVNVNAHLINLSSRSYVGTGAQVLVTGFVVGGAGTKQVLVRGDGPILSSFQIAGVLTQPFLTLFDNTSTVIATNAGWSNPSVLGSSTVAATIAPATTNVFDQVYAFHLPPSSADSAMLAGLPSAAYTAEISGVGNTTGVALAELYDGDSGTPTAHLINLSARAFVNTGSGVLVAGFVISGTSSETVLIRGIGPALGSIPFNLPGTLASPQLTLYDGTGAVIASNAGWNNAPSTGASTVAAGVQAATAPLMASLYAFSLATGSADCAMVVTLPPGAYTAQVSGKNNTTGIGLVEVYDVP